MSPKTVASQCEHRGLSEFALSRRLGVRRPKDRSSFVCWLAACCPSLRTATETAENVKPVAGASRSRIETESGGHSESGINKVLKTQRRFLPPLVENLECVVGAPPPS